MVNKGMRTLLFHLHKTKGIKLNNMLLGVHTSIETSYRKVKINSKIVVISGGEKGLEI